VIDTQQFREAGKKVMDYCQFNLKTTVMDAAEKVLDVKLRAADNNPITKNRQSG
jgi:hypothetical protein